MNKNVSWLWPILIVLSLSALAAGGCRPATEDHHEQGEDGILTLPELEPAELDGAPLQVIATTSIIGDVVAQVGGEAIQLTTLMGPGQDPHSYEPTPQQMATVSRAHVVFVNGWDLEEALVHDLEQIAAGVPAVPISAGIEPLALGEHRDGADQETQHAEEEQTHTGADPHVWFSVHNVEQWVENAERVLAALDPAHGETYERNAEAYRARLKELETYVQGQLSRIPAEKRYLITNHDSLGYLAHAYDLRVLGTVLPAASTVAEPSASEMAALVATMEEHDLCTIFAETTASARLAQTVSQELAGCDEVAVLQLYTGALGPPGSGADSYVGMLRYNVDTIVEGLQ